MTSTDAPAVPPPPSDDATIWRYTDFTKFVALLETQALFFPRVSMLDDPFEGSFPAAQTLLDRLQAMLPPGALPPGAQINLSPGLDQAWPTMRVWTFVSCWHISTYESAAMWRLYASTGAAVAIRSTVGNLRTALGQVPAFQQGYGGSEEFHIGSVEYIDYSVDRIPSTSFASQFFRKRRSFEHERELRALFMRFPITSDSHLDHTIRPVDSGLPIPVDLSVLIQAIRIAPQAPAWYADLVAKVCHRYGLTVQPVQSELDNAPLY